MGALFTHDCEACIYCFTFGGKDFYLCPRGGIDGPNCLARYGNEDGDYATTAEGIVEICRDDDPVQFDEKAMWTLSFLQTLSAYKRDPHTIWLQVMVQKAIIIYWLGNGEAPESMYDLMQFFRDGDVLKMLYLKKDFSF